MGGGIAKGGGGYSCYWCNCCDPHHRLFFKRMKLFIVSWVPPPHCMPAVFRMLPYNIEAHQLASYIYMIWQYMLKAQLGGSEISHRPIL